jgi:hypothetical protein
VYRDAPLPSPPLLLLPSPPTPPILSSFDISVPLDISSGVEISVLLVLLLLINESLDEDSSVGSLLDVCFSLVVLYDESLEEDVMDATECSGERNI